MRHSAPFNQQYTPSACEPRRAWIEAQVQLGRNAQSIYQDLVDGSAFTHRYNSVKRFVAALKSRAPARFDVLEFLPREEAQVDYGQGALTRYRPGKYKRPLLFIMTLKYSGKSFRKVVWKSNQEVWAQRVELRKIDGTTLPFSDRSVDLAFTVTVLQHNTDETMFRSLVRELCRVTRDMLVIMEDIGRSPQAGGTGDWVGRRMDVYECAFAEHGFKLDAAEFSEHPRQPPLGSENLLGLPALLRPESPRRRTDRTAGPGTDRPADAVHARAG